MSISILLRLIPWSLVVDIVMAVLEMVVEDSDNEIDDSIFDITKKVLDKAEADTPD
tara:strand:+ start:658 stop:825 length:168 start_codon:yes stop_codon:yes gene_type:complete